MRAIDAEITAAEAAELIGRSDRRVRQMHEAGLVKRTGRGRYVIADVVKAHQQLLAQEKAESSAGARTKDIQELRAQELELKIEVRKEAYLRKTMGEVLDMVDEMGGALRNDVYAIPARVTTDLKLRRKIEDEIDAAFDAASKRAAAYADRCEAAERGVDGPQAADTGRVGAAEPRLPAQRRKARAA